MKDYMKMKIRQAGKNMGVCVPDFAQKNNVVADLGLHYAPSNPEWKHFRTGFGNRNQPTKVGNYIPGKWTMALGFAVFLMLFISTSANAVETAPRISDKEIVERLTRVEEGLKALDKRIDDTNKRIDDKFEALDKRIDMIMWILGLFVSISMVTLGAVIRLQWQMMKRQTQMETSLETQKDEMTFLKGLIEKLLPPKGAL